MDDAMNLEKKLADAFDAWAKARQELGELRKGLPAAGFGAQLAESPELAEIYGRVGVQEEECHWLFQELARVGEVLADARQSREVAAQVARVIGHENKR
jgi:hypothetical protein